LKNGDASLIWCSDASTGHVNDDYLYSVRVLRERWEQLNFGALKITHSSGKTTASASPGTGSKSSQATVKGYTKKDGTYVAPHKRSAPDKSFQNNWSTKGNVNPTTGKDGTVTTPPKKP